MKKITVLLTLFLISATMLIAQELSVVSEPELDKLNDIFMVDENEGWVVGKNGSIYHTTDGFQNLTPQISGVDGELNKVYFVDQNTGWAGSKSGNILKTTDGGSTWEKIELAQFMPEGFSCSYFDVLLFTNANNGHIVIGKYKKIYLLKTSDGGSTWAVKDSLVGTSSQKWTDIQFYDDNKGVIVGDKKGTQKYTTDGGETWEPGDSTIMSAFSLSTVRWLSETDLICLGEGNEFQMAPLPIYKSTDAGATWTNITDMANPTYDRVKDMHFKDASNGVALGSNGFSKMFIYTTSDGGATWTSSAGNYSFGLNALSAHGDVIYALGTGSHIVKSTDFGATWTLFKYKTPVSINDICFAGSKGYAVNKNSDVFVNADGNGTSWEYLSSCKVWDAGKIHFINENVGLVVKENRHIVKTTDGGLTWNTVLDPVQFSSRNKVGDITFVNDMIGYVIISLNDYAEYHIYKTVNAGDTWDEVTTVTGGGYFSGGMVFFDENNGCIAGPKVKIDGVYYFGVKITSDGGSTWTDATIEGYPENFGAPSMKSAVKLNETNAIAISKKSMFKTTDKGKTWSYINHGIENIDTNFYCVSGSDNNIIIGLGDCSLISTDNCGETWNVDTTQADDYTYKTIEYNSVNNPVIGTYNGEILKYSLPTGVEDTDASNMVSSYSLGQNYPNPFNPSTTIEFSLKNASKVDVSVYNLIGQKVVTLTNNKYSAGKHSLNFDASNLTSGIYFYSMKANGYSFTKKMLLIK